MTSTQIDLDGYPTDDPRWRASSDLGRTPSGVAARLGARSDGIGFAQVVVEHYGATSTSFLWEQQLLNQDGSNRR